MQVSPEAQDYAQGKAAHNLEMAAVATQATEPYELKRTMRLFMAAGRLMAHASDMVRRGYYG